MSRLALLCFGTDLVEHLDIVRCLEPIHQKKPLSLRLLERILQLVGPVGRVDIHENYSRFRSGELGDDPFRYIGGPYCQTIAFFEPQADESLGCPIDLALELAVRVSESLVKRDNCVVFRIGFRNFIEHIADGLSNEWFLGTPERITTRDFGWHGIVTRSLYEYNTILHRVSRR